MTSPMPDQSKVLLEITEVEIDTRVAHCRDKTGGLLKATFRENGSIFLVPAVGERWQAERVGWTWHLLTRIDPVSELTVEDGDALFNAETFRLTLEGIEINSQPFGTTTRDVYYPSGSLSVYTLSAPPVHEHTVMAYYNGLLIDPNKFSINNRTMTFSIAPPAGTLVVYYQRIRGSAWDDAAVVTGHAIIGQVYADTGTVAAIGKAFQGHIDAATVTAIAIPSAVDNTRHDDAYVVISAGAPIDTDTAIFIDTGTHVAVGTGIASAEFDVTVDSATVTGVFPTTTPQQAPITLTVSGGLITDATRAVGTEGDGR